MRIYLSHGYFIREDEKEQQIMKPYPPLGILYISAYLEQHSFANEVIDNTFSDLKKFCNRIATEKPDILALYTNLMTKLNVLKIIKFIKSNNSLSHIKIILGGPEVRNSSDNFLHYGADVIVLGEGEDTMLELIKAYQLSDRPDLSTINGISFIKQQEIIRTSERALLKDINLLPFPARAKIDLQLYLNAWKKRHGQNTISISTMRGCPYTCKWCSRAVYGGTYRRRNPKLVVDEIEWLKANYTFDVLWFTDDVFTISHKWLREFVNELASRNIRVRYEIITRADRMNEDIIDLLKQSGCYRIWIGAESGSQKVIDNMDRRVKVEQVRNMIQLSRKHGIEAGTFIMLGYPGETQRDIKETIRHLILSDPDHYTITVAYPIKGTPLYSEVKDDFIQPPAWETSTDRDIDFKRTYNRNFYNYAVRWVYNEVHYHKQKHKSAFGLRSMTLKLKSIAAQSGMMLEKMRG
ncbi:MAG: radical SAM protein [Bacteroidetes bacterium]|nr:radical SAM protein [Bacteroidota bacterium]